MPAVANGCCNVRNESRAAETRRPAHFVPAVDIVETEAELVLTADLPGVQPENVKVEFERGVLTIGGKVEPRMPREGRLLAEYGVGDYHRVFEIETPIEPAGIAADLKDGVLTVRLAKAASARPRKIAVRAG